MQEHDFDKKHISVEYTTPSSEKSTSHSSIRKNAILQGYDIGYLDGRNHVLSLITEWAKDKSAEDIVNALSDKETIEDELQRFNPGFFNNYDENIGPIY